MSNTAYVGQQTPFSAESDFNSLSFLISQVLGKVWTVMPVKVIAATNSGADVAAGTVNVQPLVNQVDGNGNPTPHGTIYNLQYLRLQGGSLGMIICDPQAGDIGIMLCAQRDISQVVAAKGQANPGSLRRFAPEDGIYVGAILMATATQYLRFSSAGIEIKAPTVTVTGNLVVTGSITATGDVIGNGTHLHTHLHSGVTTGSGNTGSPV